MTAFQDRRAVVFGGSSGIGLAVARALCDRGAEVTILARDPDKLADAARQMKGRVGTRSVDGRDHAAIDRFFADYGAFDHLILAMGSGAAPTPLPAIDPDLFRAAFDNKFWAQFGILQRAAGQIRDGGSITLVGGIASRRAMPGMTQYAAINGALDAMVGPLARELAPIRVNLVSPGIIDTPYWRNTPSDTRTALLERMTAALPAMRPGRPDEVARAILYAAGNAYVTGQILEVEGGLRHAAI
jgi:NAD(P)-dependent dehydrogenase (short-subunit alcohol dehydrogenase family)